MQHVTRIQETYKEFSRKIGREKTARDMIKNAFTIWT
jgi:hypothetical protein